MGGGILLRSAVPDDAEPLTALYLRSRAAALPWLARVHDDASTLWWVGHVVIPHHRVWVAHDGTRRLGFAAVAGAWLEQLYVDPDAQGRGVGRALLDAARAGSPSGIALHVFARNARARAFYEAAGFVLTAHGDGHRNEEREPDCTYRWSPPAEAA